MLFKVGTYISISTGVKGSPQGVHYKDRSKSKGDLRIYMDILGDFKDLNSIDFKYSASSLWTDSLELSSYNISIN